MFDAKTIHIIHMYFKKETKRKGVLFFQKGIECKNDHLRKEGKNAEKNLRIIFLTELIGSNKTIWHVPLLVRLCVLANDQ